MTEHAPTSQRPLEELFPLLQNKDPLKGLGSLTEQELAIVMSTLSKSEQSRLQSRWNTKHRERELLLKNPSPRQEKAAESEPTPVEVVSMEDYYKGPWTEHLTDKELGKVKGILGTDFGFIEATDPQVLIGGMKIRVKLTESGLSQEAVLVDKNLDEPGEFFIHFESNDDPRSKLSMPLNMILVPPPVQEEAIIEEATNVVMPPTSEPTPEKPMNEFRIGDYVSATAQFADGSIQDIIGRIVYAGFTKEDIYEAGICFSDTPNAPQRIAFVHDRSAIRLVEGVRDAQQIYDRTNLSPTEFIQIAGDEQGTYHVVGVADSGDLELIPTDAFNDPAVKKMLIRIVLAQRGESKDDPETVQRLQADVRQLLEPKIILRPKDEIKVTRKLKEFGKPE